MPWECSRDETNANWFCFDGVSVSVLKHHSIYDLPVEDGVGEERDRALVHEAGSSFGFGLWRSAEPRPKPLEHIEINLDKHNGVRRI